MRLQDKTLRSMLAAEYVLGTMPLRVRLRFEHYMRKDPSLQILVQQWSQKLDPMGAMLKPVRPPARVWAGIEQRLQLKAKPSLWRQLNFWRGWSALATALTLVLAIYIGIRPQPVPEPGYVAVVQNQQAQSAWLVSLEPEKQHIRVTNIQPQPLAADRDFELWLIPGEKQAPISLGLIKAGANVQLPLPETLYARLATAPAVAVSLEPRGGSPTGAPTGPVLYQGVIRAL